MNLEEFENNLILNGSNLNKWDDKLLAERAKKYIEKTKSAKELHIKYKELDKKLALLNEVPSTENLDVKIEEYVFTNVDKDRVNNSVFIIFRPQIFAPLLSLLLTIAISLFFLKDIEENPSEISIYAYAEQVLMEVKAENELEEIQTEAEFYKEMNSLI